VPAAKHAKFGGARAIGVSAETRRVYGAPMLRRGAAIGWLFCVACSRAQADDPPVPWKPPPGPAWEALPSGDEAAMDLVRKNALARKDVRAPDPAALASLPAEASQMVAGERQIAAMYDVWMNADATKPAYLVFGTLHDSRAQLEAAATIVFGMKAPWGFALEQFRAAGRWKGAPEAASVDDGDLATLTHGQAALDDGVLWRLRYRQERYDHAAWKFAYLDAMTSLVWGARGVGKPLYGCDMPPELRASFTLGGEAERGMRELHCARALRADAIALATSHAPDGGLSDDDPAPPERFAVLVGARHAEPDGLPRFFEKDARVALVRVLGGRPRAPGDEADLATRLVVTDVVLVRQKGADLLLLPDDAWGGTVDRSTDPTSDVKPPASGPGLPPANVRVTSDAPARFAMTDASVDVGARPEWIATRAGHHAYVLVGEERTFVGAIDVPDVGWTEVHFSPGARELRIVVHAS